MESEALLLSPISALSHSAGLQRPKLVYIGKMRYDALICHSHLCFALQTQMELWEEYIFEKLPDWALVLEQEVHLGLVNLPTPDSALERNKKTKPVSHPLL